MNLYYFAKDMRLADALSLIPVTVLTFFFGSEFFGIPYAPGMLLTTAAMFLYLAFALSINNYFDRENDKNSAKIKKNPVASCKLTKREGIALPLLLAAAGMVLILLMVYSPQNIVLYALFLLNGFLYSWKFKGMPLIDLASHGIYVSALFVIPAQSMGFSPVMILAGSALVFLVSTAIQMENEIRDHDADKKARAMTTAVRFGIPLSKEIYYGCNMGCLAFLSVLFLVSGDFRFLIFVPLVLCSLARLDARIIGANFEKLSLSYTAAALLIIAVF